MPLSGKPTGVITTFPGNSKLITATETAGMLSSVSEKVFKRSSLEISIPSVLAYDAEITWSKSMRLFSSSIWKIFIIHSKVRIAISWRSPALTLTEDWWNLSALTGLDFFSVNLCCFKSTLSIVSGNDSRPLSIVQTAHFSFLAWNSSSLKHFSSFCNYKKSHSINDFPTYKKVSCFCLFFWKDHAFNDGSLFLLGFVQGIEAWPYAQSFWVSRVDSQAQCVNHIFG